MVYQIVNNLLYNVFSMIDGISITSSSFVLSQNPIWKILNKKINFNYVNNLSDGFSNSEKRDLLIGIIFISDFYDYSFKYNQKKINQIVKSITFLIEKRLNKTTKPVILCISKWIPENIIRTVMNESITDKIYNCLIKNIKKIQKKNSNLYILKLDKYFSYKGFLNSFDERNWYLANCKLSVSGLETMVIAIKKVLNRIEKSPHKVLVLDCDNTLWGGIIGEDGISGIKLGQDGLGKAFVDFQKIIKNLMNEGVILAVCSKNNHKDVIEVFNKHSSMYLKKKDILIFKVNWSEKFLNLKEISNELGLSLNSFVFWDDNPLERDKVRNNLPDVHVVDPPKEVASWPRILIEVDQLAKFSVTLEDKKKQKQYKIKSKFENEIKKTSNTNKYLKSIKLKPKIHLIRKSTIERAHQIIMKTNQFNLRTERFEKKELEKFSDSKKNICFLVSLKDVYGDHGIVGLVMASKLNNSSIFLNNFIMSCRILGRYLETWMFQKLVKFSKQNGIKTIYGEYIKTKKNILVENLLQDHGFIKTKDKNSKKIYFAKTNNIKLPNIEIYE